jgi:hypothetical protein
MSSSSSSNTPTDTPTPTDTDIPPDVQSALSLLYNHPTHTQTNTHICIITTGAGGHLSAWMLGTPGASNILTELSSPYSKGAIIDYLGGRPPKGIYIYVCM